MAKVTDLIKNDKIRYSFELTPGVSEEEIDKLQVDPAFFSVTWHAKTHQCKDMNIEPLQIASLLKRKQKEVLLHISCDLMKATYLKHLLVTLREKNICNLFVILGENYNSESSDFKNTLQLIQFIRQQAGDYFCIGIAGFPDCADEKILQMKEKIDGGANFIITQAFFDINTFKDFTARCEKLGIQAPIIPGVFPFESYKQLTGFISLCKIKVSNDLLERVNNTDDLGKSCSEVIELLLQGLKYECQTTHFHFFTLNKLERMNKFLNNL